MRSADTSGRWQEILSRWICRAKGGWQLLVIGIVAALVALVNLVSYLRSPDFRLMRWSRKGGIQHYVGYAHAEAAGVKIRAVDYMIEGQARRLVKFQAIGSAGLLCVAAVATVWFSTSLWLSTLILSFLLVQQLNPYHSVTQIRQGAQSSDMRQRLTAVIGGVYVLLGVVAVVVATATLWSAATAYEDGLLLWQLPLVLGIVVYAVAQKLTMAGNRRLAASQPARFGQQATEGDTLFLRSFNDDAMRIRAVNPHLGIFAVFNGMTVRFEELMAAMLANKAPLLAIGKPGEVLPELGAVRTYVSDDEWQQAVEDTATQVGSIVLVAGTTDGLGWELSHLRKWGLAQKVTVMLPPVDQAQAWNRLHRVLRQLGIDFDQVERGDDTGAWLGVLLRTVTAIGVDSDWRPVFYVSHRRDWVSFVATLMLSKDIVRGKVEPPEHGEIAAELGLELDTEADIGSVAPSQATRVKLAQDRLDGRAGRAVDHARAEASVRESGQVLAEHLFLGLVHDPGSEAAQILSSLGVDLDKTRVRVSALLPTRAD